MGFLIPIDLGRNIFKFKTQIRSLHDILIHIPPLKS